MRLTPFLRQYQPFNYNAYGVEKHNNKQKSNDTKCITRHK
jgi:hypothetical protein